MGFGKEEKDISLVVLDHTGEFHFADEMNFALLTYAIGGTYSHLQMIPSDDAPDENEDVHYFIPLTHGNPIAFVIDNKMVPIYNTYAVTRDVFEAHYTPAKSKGIVQKELR